MTRVNAYLARVANAIRRHLGVCDCVVGGFGVQADGRLEAFVVVLDPSFDRDAKARENARFRRDELTLTVRPIPIEIGARPPLDAIGKPAVW